MKSIVVATDLSIRSERALRRAMSLAGKHDAALTVCHVVDEDLPAEMATLQSKEAHGALERLCRSISDHPMQIKVQIADPVEGLTALVKELAPDLLVMGVHRPRPILDLFYAPTMERVVRQMTMPVLLVRDAVDHPYSKVVAGIDLSPACAAALRAAARVAPKAEISCFHAVHIPFRGLTMPVDNEAITQAMVAEAQTDLDEWWQSADLPEACVMPEPMPVSVAEALGQVLADTRPDLLAVGAHGRMATRLNSIGSFTRDLLRDPPCDLLIVRR